MLRDVVDGSEVSANPGEERCCDVMFGGRVAVLTEAASILATLPIKQASK